MGDVSSRLAGRCRLLGLCWVDWDGGWWVVVRSSSTWVYARTSSSKVVKTTVGEQQCQEQESGRSRSQRNSYSLVPLVVQHYLSGGLPCLAA